MKTSASILAVGRPDITVVLVSYNTVHLLGRVLAALESGRNGLSLQVIVVDNASSDGSVEVLKSQYPDVELIANQTNMGFARANNQALPRLRGRYVLLLNTDAFVSPDTLSKTVSFMDANPKCGVLGVKLVGRDGSLSHRAVTSPLRGICFWRPPELRVFFLARALSMTCLGITNRFVNATGYRVAIIWYDAR